MPRVEAGIAPPIPGRYTLDGDAAVEERIGADQTLIAEAVRRLVPPAVLRGLVLMGGYGRGEGGYVQGDAGPAPYNDYDYFIVARGLGRGGRKALEQSLAAGAKSLERTVGVEVDFALLRDERLPAAEYSLMNAEMLWGHQVVAGDPQVLEAMPAMPFADLPLGEFVRLLLNRGALLLMNQRALSAPLLSVQAREVFFKYLLKAILACGDARLAGNQCYHPSYVVKRKRLQAMDWPDKVQLMGLYAQAWEAKFHPDYKRFREEDAADWQSQVIGVWLDSLAWLERIRVGKVVEDWEAYGSPALSKGQRGGLGGIPRNMAVTARDFGPAEILRHPRWSSRYPRERLISALPLLLSRPGAPLSTTPAEALSLPPGTPWMEAAETFLRLWRRYA